MKTELSAIAFKAASHPKHKFQNLYGQLDSDLLYQSWDQLNKQAAAGIDGITIATYRSNLPENIKRLEEELRGASLYPESQWKTKATGATDGRR